MFDGIDSNIGNHNTDTSIFTCPYNGLYFFNVNIVAQDGYQMTVKIVREFRYIFGALSYFHGYSAASATTITECHVGESVWVRCVSEHDYMYAGYRTPHIIGALLQAYV